MKQKLLLDQTSFLLAFLMILFCSECSKRHLKPVWQVNWSKQEITLSGEDRVEALVAVSADGRITKWLLCSNGLECIGTVVCSRLWFQQLNTYDDTI